MRQKDKVDYALVGLGIAGVCLSHQLSLLNKTFVVFDSGSLQSASRVAAGMYNPITGRRRIKTWKAETLFSGLESFYRDIEAKLGEKFLHAMRIYYPFKSIKEQNDWDSRAGTEGPFFEGPITRESVFPHLDLDPCGGVIIPSSGFVDLPGLLTSYAGRLKHLGRLVQGEFDQSRLLLLDDGVEYQGIKATRLIFCDGLGVLDNPFFNWLPFRPVKGEILTIEADLQLENIINRGVFLLPIGSRRFRVGATYNWKDPSNRITASGKEELVEKLGQLMDFQYEIVDQVAGVRPATKDRRPFLGKHPRFEQIGIFNGLGTKGVSLAPYYSKQLLEHLESDSDLDREVNISRYFSLYFNLQQD